MSATALMEDLTLRGVVLSANGDRLSFDAPEGALTDELLETLKAHKSALLELLTRPNSPPAEENIETHDSAFVVFSAGLELCPVCHNTLCEEPGKLFVHRWCATAGHFDSWRTKNGLKLKQTDAPITRRPRASLPGAAEQITAQAE